MNLVIFDQVKEEDLGNYTCRAENNLGVAEQILVVSGHTTTFVYS